MKCAICKKEILEGKKLCDECKRKCLIIGLIIFIVVFILFLVVKIFTTSKVGNSIGNLSDYGYVATKGKWIYYVSPNENLTQIGIFKAKEDGTKKKEIIMLEDIDILSLNVYDNYIYFIGKNNQQINENDDIDNKIYRVKTNGKNLQILNDNEFNNDCDSIYVVDKKIYYIGEDSNIYKMNLNGKHRTLVSEDGIGYVGITDKYIIYNDNLKTFQSEDSEEYINSGEYVTKIMNLQGDNQRDIIENKRLYTVNIDGDYIYYTNEKGNICRTKINSNSEEIILDKEVYNLNVKDGYIYYLAYDEDDNITMYKLKEDGTEESTKLTNIQTSGSCLNLTKNSVYCIDTDTSIGAFLINLVKTKLNDDGTEQKIELYRYDYSSK